MNRRRLVAAAVAAVGLLIGTGPALGVVGDSSGVGGAGSGEQPPPGAPAVPGTDFVLQGQPPPGAPAVPGTTFALGTQPANHNPQQTGPPTTVEGPREPPTPPVVRHGRIDKGGVTAARSRGRTD